MEEFHYNSTRLPGNDRLDSSDVSVLVGLSRSFIDEVTARAGVAATAACGTGAVHGRASSASTNNAAKLSTAASQLVRCEVLYFDGSVPSVCIEQDDASCPYGVRLTLSPLPEVAVRCVVDMAKQQMRVWFSRKMPLSSSHAGRRFKLVLSLGDDDVVVSRPFVVLAKKAKAGTPAKVKFQPEYVPMDSDREARLARVCAAAGSDCAAARPLLVAGASLAIPSTLKCRSCGDGVVGAVADCVPASTRSSGKPSSSLRGVSTDGGDAGVGSVSPSTSSGSSGQSCTSQSTAAMHASSRCGTLKRSREVSPQQCGAADAHDNENDDDASADCVQEKRQHVLGGEGEVVVGVVDAADGEFGVTSLMNPHSPPQWSWLTAANEGAATGVGSCSPLGAVAGDGCLEFGGVFDTEVASPWTSIDGLFELDADMLAELDMDPVLIATA